jgi:Coenzyme PQQ synthesis protein D (PqqD)
MLRITLNSTLRPHDDVVVRELDGEAIMLNLASGTYFGLDQIGTRMWFLIERHGQLDIVLDRLRKEYDAPDATLEQDLLRLSSELVDKGLLVHHVWPSGA